MRVDPILERLALPIEIELQVVTLGRDDQIMNSVLG